MCRFPSPPDAKKLSEKQLNSLLKVQQEPLKRNGYPALLAADLSIKHPASLSLLKVAKYFRQSPTNPDTFPFFKKAQNSEISVIVTKERK